MANAPKAYWKFDDGSGTSVADASGNSNTGTLTNGPTWNSSVPSAIKFTNPKCVSLDGTDDRINVGTTGYATQTAGTFAAWVKTNANGVAGGLLGCGSTADGLNRIIISVNSSNQLQYATVGISDASAYALIGTTAWDWTVWRHIACVVDVGSVLLYVDGVLQSTTENVAGATAKIRFFGSLNGDKITSLGARIATGTYGVFLAGLLDDVRIYAPDKLTASEIAFLASGNNLGRLRKRRRAA